ncbi:MAG: prepilin-type N-terminal cleavage/methylation domain-containing protein, partial [Candidatus Latescibacteria bacterium]|nr:prepilin-type N-terminal cleavage/methylation domain-containing protein [bacterium]MBD3425274.1 prepilin-type N-terminal cleavage/methylation domain-containing protein [Candidatus Latescibacterota bacterium]
MHPGYTCGRLRVPVMRQYVDNSFGFTLIEMVATVTVLGIVAAVSAPLVADLVSALSLAGGSSSEELVLRESYSRLSGELKEAVESPE